MDKIAINMGVEKRLNIAIKELEKAKLFDFQIVNDKIENAVSKLKEIISK